ncbi:hypothetical protein ACFPIF_16825 [Brevundimonas faecalis]|uniref:Uncharacterized protein n=2 Tax=Brevundimonas faecalis TaxID=947378 RepID=A0ABV2RB33_9CAUL
MKRLTPAEWGRVRERVTTMSLPDRGPDAAARMAAWLEARPGNGWFYILGSTVSFGLSIDAEAFKRWMLTELVA